jgi:hypothetical protein
MAHSSCICRVNYKFIDIKGLAPVSAFSHGPDLHPGDLDLVVHDGHTLGGCISEFTFMGRLVPSHATGHNKDFHPGSQRPMAHGKLAKGMARGDLILSGNHEIA